MCGIAGLWRPAGANEELLRAHAIRMTSEIRSRGPDDSGLWIDGRAGIVFGHRRLSVVDPGETGAQPQISANGRWVINYNGEVYNAPELRAQLSGVHFRGRSDTEVLLETISAWGLDRALAVVDGMFAFALWDRQDRRLYLARDRFGEKPLVYGWTGAGPEKTFVFASDLRAVRALSFGPRDIDPEAAALMLHFGYVPAPRTIHKAFQKIMPGTYMCIDPTGRITTNVYWDTRAEAEKASSNRLTRLSFQEAAGEVERLIVDSVRKRMVADVPVGAFLSGGIDSSLIVALMQSAPGRRAKTFSVGMPGTFDETPYAQRVAAHLGAEHRTLHLDSKTALDLVPQMARVYDEPFGDTSQMPTYLVSKEARKHVTVALTGDAGDELFIGYNHYWWMGRQWRQLQSIPGLLKTGAGMASVALGPARAARLLGVLGPILPGSLRGVSASKVERAVKGLFAKHFAELYAVPIGAPAPANARVTKPDSKEPDQETRLSDPAEWASLTDTLTSMPDDILTKVDRASMAASLETRMPYLDPAIFRFVWSLPVEFRTGGPAQKAILKEILYRYVPRPLVDRPKTGFAIPRAAWLRGPFKAWGSEMFAGLKGSILEQIAGTDVVCETWRGHLEGRTGFETWLWHALALRSFERQCFDRSDASPAIPA